MPFDRIPVDYFEWTDTDLRDFAAEQDRTMTVDIPGAVPGTELTVVAVAATAEPIHSRRAFVAAAGFPVG